ncbi:MAG TPA: nucleoid occlusion factor SlmA, partial [Burkholderiales bacterium]|nr:nucleoid occlusion factor SlmA [Burkholderiales bacterium]
RLQVRINQLHDRLEATVRQALRFAVTQNEITQNADLGAQAHLVMAFVTGRWHQFAKSGFKRDPAELWGRQWKQLMEGVLA